MHHPAITILLVGIVAVAVVLGIGNGIISATAGIVVITTAVVIGGFYTYLIAKTMTAHIPLANDAMRLIGKEGYMLADMRAHGDGVAQVSSEIWSVTSESAIDKGATVKVVGVARWKLVVEPKPSAEP